MLLEEKPRVTVSKDEAGHNYNAKPESLLNWVYQEANSDIFKKEWYIYIKAALCLMMASLFVSAITVLLLVMTNRFEYEWGSVTTGEATDRLDDVSVVIDPLVSEDAGFVTPALIETQIPKPRPVIPAGNPRIVSVLTKAEDAYLQNNPTDDGQTKGDVVKLNQSLPKPVVPGPISDQPRSNDDLTSREAPPASAGIKCSQSNDVPNQSEAMPQFWNLGDQLPSSSSDLIDIFGPPPPAFIPNGATPHQQVTITVTSNSDKVLALLSLPQFADAMNRFVEDVESLVPLLMF